jgi:hypothetical protein
MVEPTTLIALWASAKILDSKGAAKLIECLEKTAAWIFAPAQRKRLKRADIEVGIEAEIVLDSARAEREQRAAGRLRLVETRRQENIEQTLKGAFNNLPPDTEITDEPVDPDWVASFFAAAQDVSHPYVRDLFARILANEVGKPGRFSRRTLDVLRLLESAEAQFFQLACGAAVHDDAFDFVAIPHGRAHGLPLGIADQDLQRLQACGLIHSQTSEITFSPGTVLRLPQWERIRVGKHSGPMSFLTFTTAGQQIASVVSPTVHPEVRDKIIFILRRWLPDLTILDELREIEVREVAVGRPQ